MPGSGKFAQNTAAQLFAFNSQVANLAKHLSTVLTQAYRYAMGDVTGAELVVSPTPLRDIKEVAQLVQTGVATREGIVGMALRSLGVHEDEIAAEEIRARERDEADVKAKAASTTEVEARAVAAEASAVASEAAAEAAASEEGSSSE